MLVDGRARRIGPFSNAAAAANLSVSILRTTKFIDEGGDGMADRPYSYIALDRIRLTAFHTLYFGSARAYSHSLFARVSGISHSSFRLHWRRTKCRIVRLPFRLTKSREQAVSRAI